MSKASQEKQRAILELTISVLDRMLTLATTFKIQRYLLEKSAINFRDFEEEVASQKEGQAINGTGIIATRKDIATRKPKYEQGFLYDEVPLGAHELGAYVDSFPLAAAAASYFFTLLEVFGNDVACILNRGGIHTNKAWHEDVKGRADLQDTAQVDRAREAFAKHFLASKDDVPEIAAHRIVRLKKDRNEFAHDGSSDLDFSGYFEDTLAVVCHIAFLTTDETRISVYPWEDHHETFSPQSKA